MIQGWIRICEKFVGNIASFHGDLSMKSMFDHTCEVVKQ